ncbi:MAG TPA: SRPBCC family protein [Acidiferrobacterales bacterium]|nr:SRPBCC family protein [Acidiferrobacterales bacterium]
MGKPEIIYVTYIATTPEKLWAALTGGEFTKQYFFGRRIESDWKVGSPWTLWMEDGRIDCNGKVLESDPPRKLSITWHVEWMEEFRHLPDAIVTYQLDPLGGVVRLTVMESHDESLAEKYKEGGRRGWPVILCGLKSLLETGRPLPQFDFSA